MPSRTARPMPADHRAESSGSPRIRNNARKASGKTTACFHLRYRVHIDSVRAYRMTPEADGPRQAVGDSSPPRTLDRVQKPSAAEPENEARGHRAATRSCETGATSVSSPPFGPGVRTERHAHQNPGIRRALEPPAGDKTKRGRGSFCREPGTRHPAAEPGFVVRRGDPHRRDHGPGAGGGWRLPGWATAGVSRRNTAWARRAIPCPDRTNWHHPACWWPGASRWRSRCCSGRSCISARTSCRFAR